MTSWKHRLKASCSGSSPANRIAGVSEIVDAEAKIQAFLLAVEALVHEGMVTWERVNVILYRHRDAV